MRTWDIDTARSGLAIFGFRQSGVFVSEATVPASPFLEAGRIYADIDGAVNTGVAFTNPNTSAVSVFFYFTDRAGNNFCHGGLVLAAQRQLAQFLNERPFGSSTLRERMFTFIATASISAIALRGVTNEGSEFLMTTLPVTELNAEAGIGEPVHEARMLFTS